MGLFNTNNEPYFVKESSDAKRQLEVLRALEPQLNAEGIMKIKQHIKNIEYGINGEESIAFELKNSHMFMCILHDIHLKCGDLSAQIDYLVFTRKLCFVIECKNLYGNIEITNTGNFIRTMEYGGRKKRESIYSPITQNQHHLELIRQIRIQRKNNIITKLLANKFFEGFHKSIVVLANPKTILNAKYAKKEIKQKVIRADQLVKHIKDICEQSKEPELPDKEVLKLAQSFKRLHENQDKDYIDEYEKYKISGSTVDKSHYLNDVNPITSPASISIEQTPIYKELRAYRLKKSREEEIKPYFIYNNNQLKDLIGKMPRTKGQLLTVQGFGEAKADKYGDDIVMIVSKYI